LAASFFARDAEYEWTIALKRWNVEDPLRLLIIELLWYFKGSVTLIIEEANIALEIHR
jgi:hypothetical protein